MPPAADNDEDISAEQSEPEGKARAGTWGNTGEKFTRLSIRLAPASVLKGTESLFPAHLRAAAVIGHHKVDFRLQTSS